MKTNVDAVIATIPPHLVRAFSYAPNADHVRLEHNDRCSPCQRREELHDALVALAAAGYRVGDGPFTLLVFPPLATEYREPEGDHCQGQHGCGAATPAQCRCQDGGAE